MTFFTQIFELIYNFFFATDVYALVKIYVKNPQHDRVKPRGGGGSRAVYTMCKKTSDLVENGFPKHENYLELEEKKKFRVVALSTSISSRCGSGE